MSEQGDIDRLGLTDDGKVHLPAFIEATFGVPRSRARMLIATGNVRLASRISTDLDVEADGRTVQACGTSAWLPKVKDGELVDWQRCWQESAKTTLEQPPREATR